MKTIKTLLTAGTITACSLSFAVAQQQPGQQPQPGQSSPSTQSSQSTEQKQQQQAQQQDQQQSQQYGARSSQASHQKMTKLKGSSIETKDGQTLGKVEDVAVDLQTGEISFVLASSEGGGDEMVPVPPTALQVQKEGSDTKLTVNIEKQKWEQAPKVSEKEVAQLDQRAQEIYQHFGEDYQMRQQKTQRQFGAPDRPEQSGGQQQPSQDLATPQASSGSQSGQSDQSSGQSSQMGTQSSQTGSSQSGSASEYGASQRSQQQGQSSGQSDSSSTKSSQSDTAKASQSGSTSEFGASQRSQGPKLGSKLMEATINAPDQDDAAKITDMILDLEKGYVDMVLLESEYVDGTFGVVPQAFEVIQEDQLRLNVSQEDLEQAQQLQQAQIGQRAQQARMASAQQTRRSPEVYRIQEGQDSVFGAPQSRDSEKDSKKKKSEKSESKSGEPKTSK